MNGLAANDTRVTATSREQDHVLVLCHMLSNRIGNVFAPELAEHDISVPEWRVLLTVATHGATNGQSISNRWAMNKMTVSRAIDGLETRGFLQKVSVPEDRRIRALDLTPAGQKLFDQLVPVANRRYHDLLADLSPADIEKFQHLLSALISRADEISS